MISFISSTINNPWSSKDMVYKEPSWNDKVIYNPTYNSRIQLTDKNIYLCSIKQSDDRYQNFYMLAVRRNLFYFIMYIPQMDIYRAEQIGGHQLTTQILPKLGLSQKCVFSYNNSCDLNENISISDGSTFFIRVDAQVGDFLFPRCHKITNTEILQKYTLMNNTYNRAIKEFTIFEDAWNKYIDKIQKRREEQREKFNKAILKMAIKKGIIHGVPALLGLPGLGALFDIDSLFDLGDVVSIADMASISSASDILDIANSVTV